MRRILMVDDDRHTRVAIGMCSSNAGSGSRSRTVARAVLRKHAAALAAIASAPPNISRERASTG
jgi:hypothetical protein